MDLIDEMNRHVDPQHEARFGFCRAPCFECDRIDRIHGIDLRAQQHKMTQCIVVAMASLQAMADEVRREVVLLDPANYSEKETEE